MIDDITLTFVVGALFGWLVMPLLAKWARGTGPSHDGDRAGGDSGKAN